jgi:hypothetical protein
MLQGLFSRHNRIAGAVIGCLGVAVLSGATAQAALISTTACDNATLTQPFSTVGDTSEYKLVPGGSFSDGAPGWTLSHGAAVVAGSGAIGSAGSSSVNLPAGASVTSPFTCVNAAYPTFRFWARNNGLLANLTVSVIYNQPLLGQTVLPVGTVGLSGSWKPSPSMQTNAALEGLLAGGTANVALRFTAASGDSQIDGVYVDPRMSN